MIASALGRTLGSVDGNLGALFGNWTSELGAESKLIEGT
jgi:hypothetical protein